MPNMLVIANDKRNDIPNNVPIFIYSAISDVYPHSIHTAIIIENIILIASKERQAAKPAFIPLMNFLPSSVSVAFLKESPVKNVSNTVYAASTKPIMAGTISFANPVTVFKISNESLEERYVPTQMAKEIIIGKVISLKNPFKP